MFDGLTWSANLEQWQWFGGAAAVFVIAAGMLIAVKPKSSAPSKTTDTVAVRKDWTPTGRIDFADFSQSRGLCSKWRRLGLPLAHLASSTTKLVGEEEPFLRQR